MRPWRWGVLAFVVLWIPSLAGAQQPAAKARPEGYAGSASCNQCHKAEVAQFTASDKGKALLGRPRDAHDSLGCESCHGPSKRHGDSGGEERGNMIVFGGKHPSPVAAAQRQLPFLPSEDGANGVARKRARVAQRRVRGLPHGHAPGVGAQPPQETDGARDLRLVPRDPKESAGALRPHAAGSEQDGVHELPQPARLAGRPSYCSPARRTKRASPVTPTSVARSSGSTRRSSRTAPTVTTRTAAAMRKCSSSLGRDCASNATRALGIRSPRAIRRRRATIQFLFNRQCSNCHFNIHGSNHPSGFAFTR